MVPIISSCVKWWCGIPLSDTMGNAFAFSTQMDVSGQVLKIFICVVQKLLETVLKKVALMISFSIIISRITDIDPLNRSAKVRFRGFNEKMILK